MATSVKHSGFKRLIDRNPTLAILVGGAEALTFRKDSTGAYGGLQLGVPTYSSAGTIDGAGVSLATGYGAALSNRFSAFEVVADTGSTDLTGDTYEAAIHGKLNIGTTQTNASLMAGLFSLDVGASKNLSANYYALRGHLDFWGSSTISGTSHVGALSAYVEHEGTTTIGSSQYCDGVDIYQVGSPTATGYNSAVNIRANAVASNWKHGMYGAADNGIDLTCVSDGIRVTSSTLAAAAGRIGFFQGTVAAPNHGDGYGAFEIDVTATGTFAGISAAMSSWLNITGTGAVGSLIVCCQNNGIYADSGANTGSTVIFGMRAQGILTDAPTVFAPFSINTSNRAVTALFHMTSNPDVGYLANSGTSGGKVGDVPLFCDAAGTQYFVRIYSARG